MYRDIVIHSQLLRCDQTGIRYVYTKSRNELSKRNKQQQLKLMTAGNTNFMITTKTKQIRRSNKRHINKIDRLKHTFTMKIRA